MNVGQFARHIIINNPAMKNGEVLKLVKEKFPQMETKEASIAWYRSQLKKNPVQIKRTSDVVENEIVELKLRLSGLEEELRAMQEQDEQELLNQEEELKAALQRIEELKASKAKDESKVE